MTSWNIYIIRKYLERNSNNHSFPDTNHNIKNCRYQLLGGSCADVNGLYFFYPWLLNMAGVAKYLIRVEDFDSDDVLLRHVSPYTKKHLDSFDAADIGNLKVTLN